MDAGSRENVESGNPPAVIVQVINGRTRPKRADAERQRSASFLRPVAADISGLIDCADHKASKTHRMVAMIRSALYIVISSNYSLSICCAPKKICVIASQCTHWRGNLLIFSGISFSVCTVIIGGDCHVARLPRNDSVDRYCSTNRNLTYAGNHPNPPSIPGPSR